MPCSLESSPSTATPNFYNAILLTKDPRWEKNQLLELYRKQEQEGLEMLPAQFPTCPIPRTTGLSVPAAEGPWGISMDSQPSVLAT